MDMSILRDCERKYNKEGDMDIVLACKRLVADLDAKLAPCHVLNESGSVDGS